MFSVSSYFRNAHPWKKACAVFLMCVNICSCSESETKTINSLQILESLSELALLRHHPQSVHEQENNVNKSFHSLVQDLQNQNLTAEVTDFNCSSNFKNLPKAFCDGGALSKCMSVDEMLQLVPQSTKSVSEALARLCPLLLLQLHSNVCENPTPMDKTKLRPSSAAVWGYGILFVTVISCCSLVGVIILPLLSKDVYHVVLMLFEGLAVGSLAGSSLFHLIPQTFQLVGQDLEHGYLWKSLIIFGGIYLFYLSERLMKIFIDVKEGKKKKRSLTFDAENSVEPLKPLQESFSRNGSISVNSKKDECEKESMANGTLQILNTEKLNIQNGYTLVNGTTNQNSVTKYKTHKSDQIHHSHHHDHAIHIEKGQSTVSTVAWMIIFGDGLHNFIDGLSIGAAFSESVLAGVSISVAVVCEEFPHELGDFAVLLSAGMTMRQALLYNFLSAITCYGGLVFGILLGDLAEASPYVFALAAGMFLYISLVDMMGELSEAIADARKKGTSTQLKVLFIQNVGIILGVAILFVMARYAEHFNFDGLTSVETVESTVDDHVKALYSGLQEVKHLESYMI